MTHLSLSPRRRNLLLFAAFFIVLTPAWAEPQPVTTANYKQAAKYSREYLRQFIYDTSVTPNWIGKTDVFWYSYRTSKGTNWWKVDPKQAAKTPLFDHVKMAATRPYSASDAASPSAPATSTHPRGSRSDNRPMATAPIAPPSSNDSD